MVYIGNGNFIHITSTSVVPKYKLELSHIINCEAVKNSLIIIYSEDGHEMGTERRARRIRVAFDFASDEQVKKVAALFKRQIKVHSELH